MKVRETKMQELHPIGVRHCYHCGKDGPHRVYVDFDEKVGRRGYKVGECCRVYDAGDELSIKWVEKVLGVGR